MKKILAILLLSILTSCINHQKSATEKKTTTKSNELNFLKPREVLISELKNMWDAQSVSIAKSEQNWNGKVTNSITVLINNTKKSSSEEIDKTIIPSLNLLKNDIINYKQFQKINIYYSFITKSGEQLNGKREFLTEKI